ncbi:Thioesterase/thiol ester dehydrase-isomerase [Pseudovirgaria hyperparasitica]|uniref:Thioesterase/thiol ester dehydrase-isomerase n=1 Tax=Pseudovirgaria hyperparasitica TaxID=470096 RepID=A0A6A6WCA5_9PEZI|nr:Thioesterase/thiol ester dehydrase-isomerase [Pseudovirgaria hyperparasitica]KAF2759809.1 Thioesterase/thiol ester dehydrase-isomerase [Pseudovirgaria hyperparasitica]
MIVQAPRSAVRRLSRSIRLFQSHSTHPTTPGHRHLHVSAPRSTDGVFRALTENRVQTPWIEALRSKQAGGPDPSQSTGKAETPRDRELTPKRMSDSYHSVILPLAQDPWLLDTYLNAAGHIRLGTILMDLDALSGVIAYKHTGDGVTTVTAACDRITIKHPLTEICDLEYSGQVTYATGRSSMEISLQVARAPKDGEKVKDEDVLLHCTFTMVSLDPGTKKPVNINPITPSTPEEHRLFAAGARNSSARKQQAQTALLKHTPNDLESDIIHHMWQKQLQYHDPSDALRRPDNLTFMDATVLRTTSIMQPQFRNRHHFMIFGGFLLKQTFELAFCTAAQFARSRPTFVSLDPSAFLNPVPVGSILYLTATVVYTDPPLVPATDAEAEDARSSSASAHHTRVQVRVDSKVRSVEHGEAKPTGQFHFTFHVEGNGRVMPRTYTEYMMYIDARRRAKRVAESLAEDAPLVARRIGSLDSVTE